MSKDVTVNTSGGIGFLGALALLFVAGKIFGFLDWSWWWVFSPIWIPWAIIATGGVVFGAVVLVMYCLDEYEQSKRNRIRR